MSMEITVNTVARTYQPAYDDEYKKALDAGHTILGKASVKLPDAVGALTLPAESHLIKSVSAAGKGRRGTISLKDKALGLTPGTTIDHTTAITFYFPKGDPSSAARLAAQLQGLAAAILADEGRVIQELILGVIVLS